MDILYFVLISFILTIVLIKYFIPILKKNKIVGIDQQKINKPKIPTSGGVPVFLGVLITIFLYLFYNNFNTINVRLILVSLISISSVFLIGLLDDLHFDSKSRKNKYGDVQLRVGLPQWLKPMLTAIAFLPLFFIIENAIIDVPFFGVLDLGFLNYIFLFILFVVFSNSTNMLAGMNGLEGSLLFIISLVLGIFFTIHNQIELSTISFIFTAATFAYLLFNWYPAKILPGDSLTYLFGGYFATVVVLGHSKLFALILFIPWILEILLKVRGKLKVRSLGDIQKDGTLKEPYSKIYSWTHIIMIYFPYIFKRRAKEFEVTICISLFVILFSIIAFLII